MAEVRLSELFREAAMVAPVVIEKRNLLKGASVAAIAGALIVPSAFAASRKTEQNSEKEPAVTPPEDLMREHGVLDRLLLVYEAGLKKFDANETFDPAIITGAAQIVRDFIENYHEGSEEQAVFPRFKKAGKMVSLVDTLLAQHKAGRRVTERILQYAPGSGKDGGDRRQLVPAIRSFIAMYRPHGAREDTDLFPLLKEIVSPHEYDAMAEDFEKEGTQAVRRRWLRDDGPPRRRPRAVHRDQ
jgi:hemerythrin-like domain-containing protein